MSKDVIVFKAVPQDAVKYDLLKKLVQQKGSLLLKNKRDRSFVFNVTEVSESLHLTCSHVNFNPMEFQSSDYFSASFSLGAEKYLFETHPLVNDQGLTLNVTDLFHLQRRKDFRYAIPGAYQATISIQSVNHLNSDYSGTVTDLNTVGCAVRMNQDNFELNMHDHLQIEVKLGSREALKLNAVVKNVRVANEADLVLGLEFENIVSAQEDQIIEAINDLQRELYFRNVG